MGRTMATATPRTTEMAAAAATASAMSTANARNLLGRPAAVKPSAFRSRYCYLGKKGWEPTGIDRV